MVTGNRDNILIQTVQPHGITMRTVLMVVQIICAILHLGTKLPVIRQEVTKQHALQLGNVSPVIIWHTNILTVAGELANIALMVALMVTVTLHQVTIRVIKQEVTKQLALQLGNVCLVII